MAKNASGKHKFSYVVKDSQGRVQEGVMSAPTADVVIGSLTRKGMTLLEDPTLVSGTGLNMELSFGRKKRIKQKEVALFARKASAMLDAGIPIKRVVHTLANSQGQNPRMSEALRDIEELLASGTSFSEAAGKHPEVFSPLMVAMLVAGEAGFMDKAMRQIAENLEKEVRLKGKIRSAMTYPIVVLAMALLLSAAMLLFIVPIFDDLFKSLGGQLPLPTQILIWLSDFLKMAIGPLVVVGFVFAGWWRKNKNNLKVRKFKDPLILRIPILGNLVQKVIMSRFSRNLATLLDNGVNILTSLTITAGTTGSIILEEAILDIIDQLRKGEEFPAAMRRHEFFPLADVEMIAVGDEAGDLIPMLEKISEIYDQDIDATTDALTSLIEPLMMVILGVIVGSMIIALYLPIFSLPSQIMNS